MQITLDIPVIDSPFSVPPEGGLYVIGNAVYFHNSLDGSVRWAARVPDEASNSAENLQAAVTEVQVGAPEASSSPCALLDRDFVLKLVAVVQHPELVKELV